MQRLTNTSINVAVCDNAIRIVERKPVTGLSVIDTTTITLSIQQAEQLRLVLAQAIEAASQDTRQTALDVL